MKKHTGISSVLAALLALATVTSGGDAQAVGTRTFDLSSMDDIAAGDLTGVAVDGQGFLQAGLQLGKVAVDQGQSAWQSVLMPDGSLIIGTGNEGKILRVAGAKVDVIATTGQMAVSSLALAWNGDIIAGSFPDGKLFRLPKAALTTPAKEGENAKEFGTKIDGVDAIWALAYDEKSKSLYAATGPEGKVLRIDDQGKAQVHFDAEDPHITSLTVAPDGKVYCGTSGKALLYRIDAPGRAAVVYDFEADDVSSIAIAKDGTVWAAANKYGGSFTLPSKGGSGFAGPQSARPSRGGEGFLYRFKKGAAEEMIASKKDHFTTISLADDGSPYVGTGAEGRVLTVNEDHLERIVADTEERQISSLFMAGNKRVVVGSDPIVVHEVRGEGGPDALWTSKVMDAGLTADFGAIGWRGKGSVEVMTRSGGTLEPDASWSAWSNALTQPGKVQSPKARYLQVRTRFARDAKAQLSELRIHFVTENARAILTQISAESRVQKSGKLQTGLQASGGGAPKPSTTVNLKWESNNPDKDELRYRVSYRLDAQQTWRDALKPNEVLTKNSLDWDTSNLPEGLYRIRVEATDETVNPPDRITKHSLESAVVLVDNTPPLFKSLAINGRKLTGEVVDGLGPISRIEISLAGVDDWRPIFPTDLIFDDAAERFDTDVSSIIPAGSRLVGVRAYDQAGNLVLKELEAK